MTFRNSAMGRRPNAQPTVGSWTPQLNVDRRKVNVTLPSSVMARWVCAREMPRSRISPLAPPTPTNARPISVCPVAASIPVVPMERHARRTRTSVLKMCVVPERVCIQASRRELHVRTRRPMTARLRIPATVPARAKRMISRTARHAPLTRATARLMYV